MARGRRQYASSRASLRAVQQERSASRSVGQAQQKSMTARQAQQKPTTGPQQKSMATRQAGSGTQSGIVREQLKLARYRIPGENLMDMYVEASEGHDDFLMSIALCAEAVRILPARPIVESAIIRPRRAYPQQFESRF